MIAEKRKVFFLSFFSFTLEIFQICSESLRLTHVSCIIHNLGEANLTCNS